MSTEGCAARAVPGGDVDTAAERDRGDRPDQACELGRSSSDWTRTSNPAINSRMLCQLSYGGPLVRERRPLADGRNPTTRGSGASSAPPSPALGERPIGALGQDGGNRSRPSRRGGDMLKFLLGAAVGYVLGAKAGHERYEQLHRTYQRVADHPAVQGAAGVVRARVEETMNGGRHTEAASNGHHR